MGPIGLGLIVGVMCLWGIVRIDAILKRGREESEAIERASRNRLPSYAEIVRAYNGIRKPLVRMCPIAWVDADGNKRVSMGYRDEDGGIYRVDEAMNVAQRRAVWMGAMPTIEDIDVLIDETKVEPRGGA